MANPKGNPAKKGEARRLGSPNAAPKAIKDMILGALSEVGGKDYLVKQAELNPVAFMGLVGKLIPKDINASVKADLVMTTINRVIVDGTDNSNT
jgi:hypothetical protein